MTVDRIHGALAGAALGDALGAATELRTARQIREHFGGPVRDFVPIPADTFARGRTPGTFTDDFSQALYLARAIVASGGKLDASTGRAAILAWADDARYAGFAGPTTERALARLRAQDVAVPFYLYRGAEATNGAAMRIGPVGCVAHTPPAAIAGAIAVSVPTHDNHLACAAAALVAAGVAAGVAGAAGGIDAHGGIDTNGHAWSAGVVHTCLQYAGLAEARSLAATHEVAGASVAARTALAVQLAHGAADLDEATAAIADLIGTGLKANEAVPAAIGILAAAPDPFSAIIAAVNAGDDTDTVATIVGSLAGAAAGVASLPAALLARVEEVNECDLAALARDLAAVRL